MYSRSFGFSLLALLFLGLLTGCNKSAERSNQAPKPPPLETIARVHWLGFKRFASETNAGYFMTIWDLPETARLRAQTLDKLALWLSGAEPASTNPQPAVSGPDSSTGTHKAETNSELLSASSSSAQIKNQNSKFKNALIPLLEDLINQESYLEIRAATNQPAEVALAIHLDEARSSLWQTNLALVSQFLNAARPTPHASSNQYSVISNQYPVTSNQHPASSIQHPVSSIQLSAFSAQSFRGWILLGLSNRSNSTALADFRARITRNGRPFIPAATNFWLDANVDLPRIASALGLNWNLPTNCPRTSLTVIGDGSNVRTHGQFDFPGPLPIELEPWNIPTNLIHDPLIGFTALRGFSHWLDSFKPWKDLQAGATPNQAYVWDQEGVPAEQFCAAEFVDTSNVVQRLSDRLLQVANPWIQAERLGQLQKATNYDGLEWRGAPFISPQLRSVIDSAGEFVLAGLIPLARTNAPAPPDLLLQVSSRTNLLYYDWEITKEGLNHWLYLVQLYRFLSLKAQLPTDSLSFLWLKAAAPRLGNCVTLLTLSSPTQIELVRKSSFGLSSIDLHLLADWLESPKFPFGWHTFLVSPPPRSTPQTNSVPPTPQNIRTTVQRTATDK